MKLRKLMKYYGWVGTAATVYNRVLKPIYEVLREEAYKDDKRAANRIRKAAIKNKVNKKVAINKTRKPKTKKATEEQ